MEQYIGRIVVIFSPILFGLAAWFSTWCADNLPGTPQIAPKDLGEIAVAGVLAAGLALYKWLDNRGKHERGEGA